MNLKELAKIYCILASCGFKHLHMDENGKVTIEFHSASDASWASTLLASNVQCAGFLLTFQVQDIKG